VTTKKVLSLIVCFIGFAVPLQAQTLARAEVTATVRIPEFLSMHVGEATEIDNGTRRVTVFVTANRGWQLSVVNACGTCTVRMEGAEGRSGNDIPVTVEYAWPEGTNPPPMKYVLVPA
jgi:hypothetical protein